MRGGNRSNRPGSQNGQRQQQNRGRQLYINNTPDTSRASSTMSYGQNDFLNDYPQSPTPNGFGRRSRGSYGSPNPHHQTRFNTSRDLLIKVPYTGSAQSILSKGTRVKFELSTPALLEFLESSLEKIKLSEDSRHERIKFIASETGLNRVRQVAEAEFSATYSVLQPVFTSHCFTFLQILSDDDVLNSLTLETPVGTIFNVLYGHNGTRGVTFFQRVLQCLQALRPGMEAAASWDEESWKEAVYMTTIVLHKTITLNQTAILKSEFSALNDQLHDLSQLEILAPDALLSAIRQNIEIIGQILTVGCEIPTESSKGGPQKTLARPAATAEYYVDFPGDSSERGPRHDNDHSDISEILILPTVGEILNYDRDEFLPTKRAYELKSHHHEVGIRRLLDSQFRLLREDTSGQLRDAIRFIVSNWDELNSPGNWADKRQLIRNHSPTPLRLYLGADIQTIRPDFKKGMEVVVEFDQLSRLKRQPFNKREQWWWKSKDLRENKSIVALVERIENSINVAFLIVSKREVHSPPPAEGAPKEKNISDLASDSERASITLRLADFENTLDQSLLIRLATEHNSRYQRRALLMVELPAVIFKNFEKILRCLQILHKESPSRLPLQRWLTPFIRESPNDPISQPVYKVPFMPAPAYLQGVTLNLSSTFRNSDKGAKSTSSDAVDDLSFSLSHDPQNLAQTLSSRTTLDYGQAEAFVAAFRNELALIQGPPGCGKSYIGIKIVSCILNNRSLLNPGPIICVTYTNHALDQFLNELLKNGVTGIVRISSPSEIPEIEALAFDNYRKANASTRPKALRMQLASVRKELEACQSSIQELCDLIDLGPEAVVVTYMERRFRSFLDQMNSPPAMESPAPFSKWAKFEYWLEQGVDEDPPGGPREVDQLVNLHPESLSKSERDKVHKHLSNAAFEELDQRLTDLVSTFAKRKKVFTALHNEGDRQLLQNVNVLGLTTTGLANNSELVRGLNAKILMCEEAAEVLEAHVLTTLLPTIQHAILIGDHEQLRPRISSQTLSKEYGYGTNLYNFDESLFERLAKLKFEFQSDTTVEGMEMSFPVAQLKTQRRMHPSVSDLIRKTIYPDLEDHPSVRSYPPVVGIKKNLFWLDHRNHEDAGDPDEAMQSKTNIWEARMVSLLVTYLCRQHTYAAREIAVLTPYIAQMRLLMDLLGDIVDLEISDRDLEDLEREGKENPLDYRSGQIVKKGTLNQRVRIATVDNFQGEEATIVIISLVRSNLRQNCGFLKTPNRINVLLSRAKHGMYIIGNAETCSEVGMWQQVLRIFEIKGNIGQKIELECSRHPNKKTLVSSPEDFEEQCPEGGCSEKCGLRLRCGHVCDFKCHPKPLHDAALCRKRCERVRDCGHSCNRQCCDPCGNCPEKLDNVTLPCGHIGQRIPCYMMKDLGRYQCMVPVNRWMPRCGHPAKIACHVDVSTIKCPHPCEGDLLCGHVCKSKCFDCRTIGENGKEIIKHRQCRELCGKSSRACSHNCTRFCHEGTPCPPCQRPCDVRCKHSKCSKTCSEPCQPCAEVCNWACEHQKSKCEMPCAVPCSRLPCAKRCTKLLPRCRHQCPGVCGELCPQNKFCQQCCKGNIRGTIVDPARNVVYSEVNVNDTPMVFLTCGHFYTCSSLDGYMKLSSYYQDGESRARTNEETHPIGCPKCRTPLRDINRYNRAVKGELLNQSTRKFSIYSYDTYQTLLKRSYEFEANAKELRRQFINKWKESDFGKSRIDRQKILQVYKNPGRSILVQIDKYNASVAEADQPLAKINAMFSAAVSRHTKPGEPALPSKQFSYNGLLERGRCLELRVHWLMLWDWHLISRDDSVALQFRESLRESISSDLRALITKAKDLHAKCQKSPSLMKFQIQAAMFRGLFTILNIQNAKDKNAAFDSATETEMRKREAENLRQALVLCSRHPVTAGYLREQLVAVEDFIAQDVYEPSVTTEREKRANEENEESIGISNWAYCRNNHSYIVGHLETSAESAACPFCKDATADAGGTNSEQQQSSPTDTTTALVGLVMTPEPGNQPSDFPVGGPQNPAASPLHEGQSIETRTSDQVAEIVLEMSLGTRTI
ncbi:hypothetical protein ABW19_dt0208308 [Dactylella cylindrospora]|nr:hypothetical protein ABW19_dt0208308 [Dactylella cylindrospora]